MPLAISVVSGAQINTGSFNVGRLQQLTPTLQYYSSNPRNTSLSIRGIGAPFGLTNDGFEQGVGIYVDDVYYSRVASATFDFLDVAQIEVLRGPQGTLYGKNTTAGAINITTNQPSFNFEGKAEVSVGSLNFKQAKAAVSGPLSDKLAARLALSTTSRRGTIYNVKTSSWINGQDNLGLRGQLLWKPTDSLDITLSGDYSTQEPECCGTVFVRVGATQRPLNRQYDSLAAAQNYTVVSRNPFDRLTDIDAELNAGNDIGGVGLRIKWDVGPRHADLGHGLALLGTGARRTTATSPVCRSRPSRRTPRSRTSIPRNCATIIRARPSTSWSACSATPRKCAPRASRRSVRRPAAGCSIPATCRWARPVADPRPPTSSPATPACSTA